MKSIQIFNISSSLPYNYIVLANVSILLSIVSNHTFPFLLYTWNHEIM